MPVQDLRSSSMMCHLMDTLERGESVGHYGRLVYAMVARHFVDEDEIVSTLEKDPECDANEARSLIRQVNARNYNPPHRDRILEWMDRQQFPICPDPEDPRACNVYRELKFPREIYERIEQFYSGAPSAA
jgi:DNA primase large subunit